MAVYFFDSSALVKRYVQETGTAWVLGICNPTANAPLYIARIVTLHAKRPRAADRVTIREIGEVLRSSRDQVVENAPDDPRGTSGLMLGCTKYYSDSHFPRRKTRGKHDFRHGG